MNDLTSADLLQAYSRDPIAKYFMEDADITMTQANAVCGDFVTVYLKVDWWKITERSRDGSSEMQTTTAASMLWEVIQGEVCETVLTRDYDFIKSLGLELSPRRRRSWVTALLATKNALHQLADDGRLETFDDVL